jgi:2'-5' RNA ligase
MRLFTAIELTEDARAAIVAEQKRVAAVLTRNLGSLRLVRPEHLHLTLAFVGEVSEDRAAGIARAMTADIPLEPFQVVFAGVGAFPPRGAPRVLYLDVTEGAHAAVELHRHVAARLEAAGVGLDRRPFRPHLTLGRWRQSRPPDRPRGTSAARVAEIQVRSVTLFQSQLSSSGPTYTRLTATRLGCP